MVTLYKYEITEENIINIKNYIITKNTIKI